MTKAWQQRLLLALVVALAAAVLGLAVFWHPAPDDRSPAAAGPSGGDFVLQSADGLLDTRSLRGDVLLVYFGYTYCPDICPTSLYAIGQGLGLLKPEEVAHVRVIFVSVDPERDTPARLKEYGTYYHRNVIGVTGTPQQVAAAAKLFGAFYAKQQVGGSTGYVVDHSATTYIVAPDGRLVDTFPHGTTPEQVAAQVRRWLPASRSSNVKGTT